MNIYGIAGSTTISSLIVKEFLLSYMCPAQDDEHRIDQHRFQHISKIQEDSDE